MMDYFLLSVLGSLCSNDEEARNKAAETMKCLSLQCSNGDAVYDVADHLFQVLNGSQGKITVADHKIAILQVVMFHFVYVLRICVA